MVTKSFKHRPHNCSCDHCGETFYKTPSLIKKCKNNFCSLECRGLFNRNRESVNCLTCGKQFEKIKCNANRTKKSFCCPQCYYNYPDKIERLACHRSKVEDYLLSILTKDFPQLGIIPNDIGIIGNGLEIDLAIPSLKIAIEINGPTHYTDIYGQENLIKTQARDKRKVDSLVNLGYQLFIINISNYKNSRQAKPYVLDTYNNSIKPIIIAQHSQ